MYTFAALLARAPSGLYQLVGDSHAVQIDRLCRIKGVKLFRVHGREVRGKKRLAIRD